MIFRNCVISKEVASAIKVATDLLSPHSLMIKELSSIKNHFKYDTPDNFVELLLQQREPINVYTYRSKKPWSRVIGYFSNGKIYLNVKKLPTMEHKEIVGFLLHEYAHYCGLNHGTGFTRNYITEEKLVYSVPYFLSTCVERWL
jgi:hypothetical protein